MGADDEYRSAWASGVDRVLGWMRWKSFRLKDVLGPGGCRFRGPVPLRVGGSCWLGSVSVIRSVQVRKGRLKGKAESRRPGEFDEPGFFSRDEQMPE